MTDTKKHQAELAAAGDPTPETTGDVPAEQADTSPAEVQKERSNEYFVPSYDKDGNFNGRGGVQASSPEAAGDKVAKLNKEAK